MSATINTELVATTATSFKDAANTVLENEGVSLPSEFQSYAEAIFENLATKHVEAQHDLMDTVIEAVADNFDMAVETIKEAARAKGLPVRPEPQPEPEVEVEVEVEAEVEIEVEGNEALTEILNTLKGISVKVEKFDEVAAKVDALDALAKRHGLSA